MHIIESMFDLDEIIDKFFMSLKLYDWFGPIDGFTWDSNDHELMYNFYGKPYKVRGIGVFDTYYDIHMFYIGHINRSY